MYVKQSRILMEKQELSLKKNAEICRMLIQENLSILDNNWQNNWQRELKYKGRKDHVRHADIWESTQ